MKVIRKVTMYADHFEIGDQIKIKLKGAGKFTATCHKITDKGALFVFDNCVTRRQMNETDTTEGGFDESNLCAWLNTDFIDKFPNKYIKRMTRIGEHLISLLTKEEVFGADLPFDDQLELMKDPKHRVCSYPDGSRALWWLRDVVTSTGFANGNRVRRCDLRQRLVLDWRAPGFHDPRS
jgi:hypothetical protein